MREDIKKLIEEQIVEDLKESKSHEITEDERKKFIAETSLLLDKLKDIESKEIEFWSREDDRKIEQERLELEKEKMKMPTWKKVLEVAKVVVPVCVPIVAYGIFQEKVLRFEETGRINSTAGRELHLPKFMK